VSIGGLGAYWLEGCGLQNRTCGLFSLNQDAIAPLLIFNLKVITFSHLFLGYISFLNLCRLYRHIGYAARHFKETHLTIHNRQNAERYRSRQSLV